MDAKCPIRRPVQQPRVVRGGTWNNNQDNARGAYRNNNLRERVVQSWQSGRKQTWIAREFRIGLATVKRYIQLQQRMGHLAPKVQQRERPIISDEQLIELQQQVEAQADASLEQHIEMWAKSHGVCVSRSTLCRALARANRPLKKTVNAQERDEGERRLFADQAATLEVKHLVVVDEAGSKIGMSRTCARAPKGERAVVKEPFNKGCNYTLLAALRQEGITAPFVIEGAADGAIFEVYVAQVLAPTLRVEDVVIMDNVHFHKRDTLKALLRAREASILWLPAYSPDFSPIEHAFSKLKAWRRRVKALSQEALEQALAEGLAMITEMDALSWFIHCGYLNVA